MQHERQQSDLAAMYLREKAEADTKLAGLSKRIGEIQSESDQKLAKLAAELDQQKQEATRQDGGAHAVARADGGPDRQNQARLGCREWWGEAD